MSGTHVQTACDYPRDSCIHELFDSMAARNPDGVAIEYGTRRLIYRELAQRANQLAHYLQERGVKRNVPVAVCMEPSDDFIVGVLGILKAGGAYLPVDPGDPRARLEFMLGDANPASLITHRDVVTDLPSDGRLVVDLSAESEMIAEKPSHAPRTSNRADDLAYVMYTSGSTGKPNGVEVPHRGVVRLLFGVDYAPLDERQRFLLFSPISFDASTFEIWGPLLHGGTCVISSNRSTDLALLARVLKESSITCLWLTSALFNSIIDHFPEALSTVPFLIVGGEALSVSHVRRALDLLPEARIVNGYGPTEGTTFTCTYEIPRNLSSDVRSVPIGRPIAHTEAFILDESMREVVDGAVGELYIGGDGLARRYVNRSDLTAEKFVAHPFSRKPGARLFRSGDLGRVLSDGNIEFLGRIDHQVKVRGHRIELGEVEVALRSHPDVLDSVVVATGSGPTHRLVAFVVAPALPDPADVIEKVRGVLPAWMVPSSVTVLDCIPTGATGKTDREALHRRAEEIQVGRGRSEMTSRDCSAAVRQLWASLLSLDEASDEDDFFEVGGHSLIAIQLVSSLGERLGIKLSLRELFDRPRLGDFVITVESRWRELVGELPDKEERCPHP